MADLAAAGLTNREIAEQLYVTIKTVETHLNAVYRKLGIRQPGRARVALSAPSRQAESAPSVPAPAP